MEIENTDTAFRTATNSVRKLTEQDEENLRKQDSRLVSSFQAGKLKENAKKYWDQFYNRNKTKFFKDRHWTTREFGELLGDVPRSKMKLLEIGCGVGNLIFPLVEEGTDMEIFACDFSPRAVEYVKSHKLYETNKINAFQADVIVDDLLTRTGVEVDLVTMVFVLSAIHPDKFKSAIDNVYRVLRPGGLVLFRDYGIHDMAQIRFKVLNKTFEGSGFEVVNSSYIETRTVNRKEGINVPRVFVQGKFSKPES